ncbi:hypothetical protein [Nitrosomonas sp.]|uniref:hypothetical protein n=1 Tax=Nitrosomonas sp. TaxID=42353 RepID=UPI0025F2C8DC|nr:hypothetical protein [Nitrosomonas sp.]MBY0484261.1 hypothetical protein [Nitrosomonas sp.]
MVTVAAVFIESIRCLVHAGVSGTAAAVAKDADHRSSTVRCRAFLPPDGVSRPGRGRSKTYGIKIMPEAIQNLPVIEVKLTLYGRSS